MSPTSIVPTVSLLQTDSEYQEVILTYQKADYSKAGDRVKVYQPEPGLQLPDSLDWRTRSAVSKVQNQVTLNVCTPQL